MIDQEKYLEAIPLLEKSIKLYPRQRGGSSPYGMLSLAHRELGQADNELSVLEKWAAIEDSATKLYERVMKIYADLLNILRGNLNKPFGISSSILSIGH